MFDVVVLGAGPAGLEAARRSAELGARVALVERGLIGGVGANDGPVPVRSLAHAARLLREAEQLERYGIDWKPPQVDCARLLERVRAVVEQVRGGTQATETLGSLGVTLFDRAGMSWFEDPHTIATESGRRIEAANFILCTGGHNRKLPIEGGEHISSHSDVWSMQHIPDSIAVIGAGATGVQIASIFNAFGSQVTVLEAADRILTAEDVDVSAAMANAYRANGVRVIENIDGVDRVEKNGEALTVHYSHQGQPTTERVSMVVAAVGWAANVEGLKLENAGVETNRYGYVEVNDFLQTSAEHTYAAGDVAGLTMLVPSALHEGFCAATNAVLGPQQRFTLDVVPAGSFTDPEYGRVGMTEAQAREHHEIAVATIEFNDHPRSLIDGNTNGFCKLIADRETQQFLGAHVVGERAVETVQMVATGMAAGLTVEQLNGIPLSFPTYVGIVGQAAFELNQQLNPESQRDAWQPHRFLM